LCLLLRMYSKFQHDIKHQCLLIHLKQKNKPCFRSPIFFLSNILPIVHLLNMFIIIMFCLCPHESFRIWNFNTFLQKCSSIQDCASFLHYSFWFMPFDLDPFVVLLPSLALLWIVVLPLALLWIVIFPP